MTYVEIARYIQKNLPKSCFVINNGYDINTMDENDEDYAMNYASDMLSAFENDNGGLGLCGCGVFSLTRRLISGYLRTLSVEDYDKKKSAQQELFGCTDENVVWGITQFFGYVLDNAEFIHHGSSIGGAWITEKGKVYLELCEKVIKDGLED